MIAISIKNNFPDVAKQLRQVTEQIGNKAVARALNTTVAQGKVQMAKQITSEFRLSSAEAKKRLDVDRANAKQGGLYLSARLSASKGKGRSMNLIKFLTSGATKRNSNAGDAGQLRFQIKRSGGAKIKRGAFIGNQGRTVFIRTSKGRTPINALSTIDVPQMFNTRRINQIVKSVMLDRFDANFTKELRAVLGGFAK